jgi:hypothetical protein
MLGDIVLQYFAVDPIDPEDTLQRPRSICEVCWLLRWRADDIDGLYSLLLVYS